jgi:hypothetical protein
MSSRTAFGQRRGANLRSLGISLSHGAQWKALISAYMIVIPPSADVRCAEQIITGASPPISVVNAIAPNVGAAARLNQRASPNASLLSLMFALLL